MSGRQAARSRRVAIVGVSESGTCGVRDHGELLAAGLAAEGLEPGWHWLTRQAASLPAVRAEFAQWTQRLRSELGEERPDAVVLQYSVFSYSYRGFPLFVPAVLEAAASSGAPVVGLLHEFIYPRGRSLKGEAWALSQAIALRAVVARCSALVVTAPSRAEWLATRRWLPRRELVLAPVYSNLPPPRPAAAQAGASERIGLFGYAYEGAAMALVLDTLALLRAQRPEARLMLLGAPGAASPAAEVWRAAAEERGVAEALSFSGVLPAQELSDALAGCDVLLHPEPSGPTSRKGTLAGSLASGTAVLALDGPRSWSDLLEARAVAVADPNPAALAAALDQLLADDAAREQLGTRGRSFHDSAMSVQRTARSVAATIDRLLA